MVKFWLTTSILQFIYQPFELKKRSKQGILNPKKCSNTPWTSPEQYWKSPKKFFFLHQQLSKITFSTVTNSWKFDRKFIFCRIIAQQALLGNGLMWKKKNTYFFFNMNSPKKMDLQQNKRQNSLIFNFCPNYVPCDNMPERLEIRNCRPKKFWLRNRLLVQIYKNLLFLQKKMKRAALFFSFSTNCKTQRDHLLGWLFD